MVFMTEQEIVNSLNEFLNSKSEQEQHMFDSTGIEDIIAYHPTFGMYIRNKYKLWETLWKPEIDNKGVDISTQHPDAISMRIIRELHRKRNNGG